MSKVDKLDVLDMSKCVPACKVEHLDSRLVARLLHVQRLIGFPLIPTSGFRTLEWEKAKGRSGKSSHCHRDKDGNAASLAIDVAVKDSFERFKILFACLYCDIPRIGVGKTFLHLDIDSSKPHPIIFHYYD